MVGAPRRATSKPKRPSHGASAGARLKEPVFRLRRSAAPARSPRRGGRRLLRCPSVRRVLRASIDRLGCHDQSDRVRQLPSLLR